MPISNPSALDSLSSPGGSPARVRGRAPWWLLPGGLLAGFLLIFGLLFGERLLPALPVRTAPVISVRTGDSIAVQETPGSRVEAGPGPLLFQASGWIEPDPYIIAVPTLTDGTVETVHVLAGENVTSGQLLATLIDEDARLDLAEAESRIETLRAEIAAQRSRIPAAEARRVGLEKRVASETALLDERVDQFERLASLRRGSVPARDIRAAELQVAQQRARVEEVRSGIPAIDAELETIRFQIEAMEKTLLEAEVARDRARLDLDRHTIHSPMDGVVLHLHAAPGQKRLLRMDDPKSAFIVEIFDPNNLQARIDVPLSEASAIQLGMPVEMTTDLLADVTLRGSVTRVTGEADLQRNTLQVKASIENPDPRLRPEMLVRGKFFAPPASSENPRTASSAPGRLAHFVPEEALADDGRLWVVSPEETAEVRSVEVGREKRDGHVLVRSGIRAGERVILPPHETLTPGARVRVISSD